MDSIVELILKIKQRPAMYITRNYISCLYAFLDGWCLRAIDDVVDGQVMEDFQNWIVRKYKVKTAHLWADIILFYSTDEYKALEKFFKEFELFLSERAK